MRGEAELVIGVRNINQIGHFPPLKKALQKLGSIVVGLASHTHITDAPSGFRAISRATAERLMVYNDHTYTLETIIQAGHSNMAIATVPVRVDTATRPSRLVSSQWSYVAKGLFTIVRAFVIYRPWWFFGGIGAEELVSGGRRGAQLRGEWSDPARRPI